MDWFRSKPIRTKIVVSILMARALVPNGFLLVFWALVLSQQGWAFSSRSKSISIKEFYHILFYHLKKPLYYLYHTILQYLQHPKTLFLLKYYFLIFRYYFFPTVTFFQTLAWINFLGLSNSIYFSQSPSTSNTDSTHRTTHTEPWYTDQPIHTHHHTCRATHTYTNTNHQQSHTHTNHQTGWSQQRPRHPPPKPLISKPKPSIKNPHRRFETHRSKPIQKKSSP